MNNWFKSRNGAYFFLLLGVGLMMVFGVLEFRFPRADKLEIATGRVVWSQPTRGALHFSLDGGEPRQFVLYAKGDADGRMQAALLDAVAYPVTIRFDRAQVDQTAIGDFHVAYGVSVGGKDVASLDVVRSSYRHDNLIALAMGCVFAAAGAARLYQDRDSIAATGHRAGGGRQTIRR